MNTFRMNKILGTVLGTLLFLQTVHIVDGAFKPHKVVEPGSKVAVKEGQPAEAKEAGVPFDSLLASASAERGAEFAKPCAICHNFEEGQGPKIGPALYGVVGRPVASAPGFNYSAPLKAKGGTWTFDALNTWLADPRVFVPGTTMAFAGLPSEKRRADVVAYLQSLSKNPLPLPKAKSEK